MDTLKNFLFTMIVGGAIVTGITYQVNRHNNPDTYTVEPRLVEMYEHENAYLIWLSDPVSRLFILDKRMGPVEIVGGASYTITKLPAAYTLEDPFETKPWEVSYIKREGWPDSPRGVMGEKGSKVKWWVQDGTWGRGVQ